MLLHILNRFNLVALTNFHTLFLASNISRVRESLPMLLAHMSTYPESLLVYTWLDPTTPSL